MRNSVVTSVIAHLLLLLLLLGDYDPFRHFKKPKEFVVSSASIVVEHEKKVSKKVALKVEQKQQKQNTAIKKPKKYQTTNKEKLKVVYKKRLKATLKKKLKKKKKKTQDDFATEMEKTLNEALQKKRSKKKLDANFDNLATEMLVHEKHQFTLTQINNIKLKILNNWNIRLFSMSKKIVVIIKLDKYGNITAVKTKHKIAKKDYPFFLSAAKAIQRSSPILDLPMEKYELWKEIEISFGI